MILQIYTAELFQPHPPPHQSTALEVLKIWVRLSFSSRLWDICITFWREILKKASCMSQLVMLVCSRFSIWNELAGCSYTQKLERSLRYDSVTCGTVEKYTVCDFSTSCYSLQSLSIFLCLERSAEIAFLSFVVQNYFMSESRHLFYHVK